MIPKGSNIEGYSDESTVINLQYQPNIISNLSLTLAIIASHWYYAGEGLRVYTAITNKEHRKL